MSSCVLNILVVGASPAGLELSHYILQNVLRELRTFDGAPAYRLILVNPLPIYIRSGSITRHSQEILSAAISPEAHSIIDIRRELAKYPHSQFEFVQGNVIAIEPSARHIAVELQIQDDLSDRRSLSVSSDGSKRTCNETSISNVEQIRTSRIPYHALIFATGSSVPNQLYVLPPTIAETLVVIEEAKRQLQCAKSIVVVGGGSAGCETAGAVALYFNKQRKSSKKPEKASQNIPQYAVEEHESIKIFDRKVHFEDKDEPPAYIEQTQKSTLFNPPKPSHKPSPAPSKSITLLSGNDRLLTKLPPTLAQKAEKQLRKLGVQVIHNIRQVSLTKNPDGTSSSILNNDSTTHADMIICATGGIPNTNFLPRSMLNSEGRVLTDGETLRVERPCLGERIYAIGSCASYWMGSGEDEYVPVPVLARNLVNDLLVHEFGLRTVKVEQASRGSCSTDGKSVQSLLGSILSEIVEEDGEDGKEGSIGGTRTSLSTDRLAKSTVSEPKAPGMLSRVQCVFGRKRETEQSTVLTKEEALAKINALQDAYYDQDYRVTQLVSITKTGGVGLIRGRRVPGCMVGILKRRRDRKLGKGKLEKEYRTGESFESN
ncbi:hypothetical protein BU24DRAFT_457316 [Aaosphaeria arxii CBS 175.79]|uniref:FAD/NAD(P)-binding domain-containing protein n=1 Tax=Aaosphaeria arxii CBS 175.79 TaxID=1450172 RepID=A0A6A5Y9R9_9PLEO|nr:uncharacterized protein BU24DRAFT_457316 [Aaosphaeria arxii CBS 175.79]KAF2021334.1 hypothetical protein BU24DRAFT_457316 [Aaosphaeria arxii CBS 175.79]